MSASQKLKLQDILNIEDTCCLGLGPKLEALQELNCFEEDSQSDV